MKISIIVAVAKNNVIGYKNQLPWYIPEDLKRFKKITSHHHIVMGQKTFESIGKPLPNRTNIILTDNPDFKSKGCVSVHSIEEAIKVAKNNGESEMIVIGGASVYEQFLPISSKIYLTKINKNYMGDRFFPRLDSKVWKIAKSKAKKDKNIGMNYTFQVLERLV